ncbi:SPFH domain-containing protein [Sandaracinus amylolyticus]|uniref:SPFH domain-containing protein n=1 Tax=Sandaracinus amylolyticus TaxID=927083 RepID=UPI001F1EE519|nr:SPFH domain-containing protein [Sandaracinus amylolyticus]UJR79572.1 NrtR-regulated protein NrtX [Sandaracinus amylolyticus]
MADIRSFLFVRHLRAESSSHVLLYKRGSLVKSGRGLTFWFFPMTASIAEVPVDDRELPLAVRARSSDFQDVTVQGVLTYRVIDPAALAEHVDFSIDTLRGVHLKQPLEKIALHLAQLAQQHASEWIGRTPLREVLRDGPATVRERVHAALAADEGVAQMGLGVASVRISSIAPTPDLERALEAPMRERIQQEADEAAFARRALAVEKERAIQENELQNQIELARREEQLISQRGANGKRQATEEAEAKRIATDGEASRLRTSSDAQAASIRAIDGAKVEMERERMAIQKEVPPAVLAALAARELATKLQRIDHLHLGADALGPMLTELASAGTRALEAKNQAR